MAGPDRVRLALDHIADALDDLDVLTADRPRSSPIA